MSDFLQQVFGQINLLYKSLGNDAHAPAVYVAGGETASSVGGAPVSATNRLPVGVLLSEIHASAQVLTISDTSAASAALPAGTVAVRVQKTSGVGVRWRVVASGGAAITNAQGGVLMPDVVGLVDVPAAPGQVVQFIRMAGDTGTGSFAVTPLGV
jgi:hypothetical protein